MLRPLIAWALAGATAAAFASPPAAPGGAEPLPWRSALEGYRPFDDQPVTPWRESNDTVGRIGGWREYAREASGMPRAPGAAPSASASAAPPASDAPAPASATRAAPPARDGHRH
jgi:hypothetical protein